MAFGSLDSWYTSGTFYKRFYQLTEAQRLNRSTVRSFDAQVRAASSLMFGATASASEQLSVLAVKQLQARVTAELAASRGSGSILNFSA
jgi:hypothetical protein